MKRLCMAFCMLCMMVGPSFAQDTYDHTWYRVYLGMGVGKAKVSADIMRDFLTREVTPRFPRGLTIIPARGQWSSPSGMIREHTVILDLYCADTPEETAKVNALADAYAKRFKDAKASVWIARIPGVKTEFKYER